MSWGLTPGAEGGPCTVSGYILSSSRLLDKGVQEGEGESAAQCQLPSAPALHQGVPSASSQGS